MNQKISKRQDVNPEEGINEYGHVEFADPVNNKYPIDNKEHIISAWRYIHQGKSAGEYSDDDVKLLEQRIVKAAKDHGMKVTHDSEGTHISED
jgi:hypothetical protein